MSYFSKDELLGFNEILLGRGMPNQQDGIGYNKADYGACSTYFNGLSNAQLADLAKRLIKYSNTQLKIDKDRMKVTAEYLFKLSDGGDRSDGVSIYIREENTIIGFRYRDSFVRVMNIRKYCKWDDGNKGWKVPNDKLIMVLKSLADVGADVDNALEYAYQNEYIKKLSDKVGEKFNQELLEVLVKLDLVNDMALLKFNYNADLINEIKLVPVKDRQWNADFKFWAVKSNHFNNIKNKFKETAIFTVV